MSAWESPRYVPRSVLGGWPTGIAASTKAILAGMSAGTSPGLSSTAGSGLTTERIRPCGATAPTRINKMSRKGKVTSWLPTCNRPSGHEGFHAHYDTAVTAVAYWGDDDKETRQ